MGILQRLFRAKETPAFGVGSGEQQTVDVHRLFLNKAKFFAGLRQDEKLTLFESIKNNIPLARGCLNTLVKMANTKIIPCSGDPEIDNRMLEIWRSIGGHQRNNELMIQALTFGFGVAEVNWDNESLEIDSVKVQRSLQIRKVPDRHGNILSYRQFASIAAAGGGSRQGMIDLDPGKVISIVHQGEDFTNYYGNSIFASAVDQLEAICQTLDASINIFNRLGKPRYHIEVNAEGLGKEQFLARLARAKEVFGNLSSGTDFYSPMGVKVSVIGAETFGVAVANEANLLIGHALAALGVPPSLLNLNAMAQGSTESFTRQVLISLQQLLSNLATTVCDAWNGSFWKIVKKLEGMNIDPRMELERPRLLEQLLEERARAMRFSNDKRELLWGLRKDRWFAQRHGASDIADPAAFAEQLRMAREKGDQDPGQRGQGETNKDNTTKGSDEKATGNTTM